MATRTSFFHSSLLISVCVSFSSSLSSFTHSVPLFHPQLSGNKQFSPYVIQWHVPFSGKTCPFAILLLDSNSWTHCNDYEHPSQDVLRPPCAFQTLSSITVLLHQGIKLCLICDICKLYLNDIIFCKWSLLYINCHQKFFATLTLKNMKHLGPNYVECFNRSSWYKIYTDF